MNLHFTASLDQVRVKVYENGKLLSVEDKSSWEHDSSCQLASLAVVGLKASGSSHDNGVMEAELCMDNFTLDDERPGTTGIRQAIRKSPLEDGGPKAMIHVAYMSSVQKEQSLTIGVDGTQVLVNLPFISMLSDFLKDSLKPLTSRARQTEAPQESSTPTEAEEALRNHESSEVQEKGDAIDTPRRKVKVFLSVTRPCVALVEKPGIPNPKTLVLEMGINASLEMEDEWWQLKGNVESLRVASTNYSSLGCVVSQNYSRVLAPTSTITASLSSTGNHSIVVPSLSFTVSPSTVRLILNSIQSIQREPHTEDELPQSAPPDLFNAKEVDKTRWYLSSNSEEERTHQLTRVVSQTSEHGREETVRMEVKEVSIVVEKENTVGPNIPIFVLTVGGWSGEDALSLTASYWPSHLTLEAQTYVQIDYYNNLHGVWEPLLEPLVDPKTDIVNAHWSLEAKLSVSSGGQQQPSDLDPDVSIEITSKDVLNLTLTKTCITLINELANAYTKGTERDEQDTQPPESYDAIYYLVNELGSHHPVTVQPGGTLKVHEGHDSTLNCGDSEHNKLPLVLADRESESKKLHRGDTTKKVHTLQLEVSGFKTRSFVLGSGDKVYYSLQPSNNSTVEYGMVVEIQQQSAMAPRVILRSPLRLKNHLYADVEVYWSLGKTTLTTWHPFALVKKNGEMCNIPLKQAHEGDLILKPCIPSTGYCEPSIPCLMTSTHVELSADVSSSPPQDYVIIVSAEEERYSKKTSHSLAKRPHHTLHLSAPYVVRNLLPLLVSFGDEEALQEIKPGSKAPISMFKGDIIKLPVKLELEQMIWIGEIEVNVNDPADSTFTVHNPEKGQLKLAVHKERKGGWKLSLYSSYWVVNKTGLTLEYECRSGKKYHNLIHPPIKQALLFSHKKSRVRVQRDLDISEWSDRFSLDTVGHGGVFVCKCKDGMQYQFGTTIQASGSGLTKIMTILPFYLVKNKTREQINFSEIDGEITSLASKEMIPFWPRSAAHQMVIKAIGDETSSAPFCFMETSFFLLHTSPAIVADVQVTDACTVITFNPYCLGAAPIQLINTISFEIIFKQDTEQATSHVLPPSRAMLYTWDDPCGKKEIVWNVEGMTPFGNRMAPKDGSGNYSRPYAVEDSSAGRPSYVTNLAVAPPSLEGHPVAHLDPYSVTARSTDPRSMDVMRNTSRIPVDATSQGEAVITEDEEGFLVMSRTSGTILKRWTTAPGYWACFMDGPQRVAVFSESEDINNRVFDKQQEEHPQPQLDVAMSLSSVVVSLVNDEVGQEIATVGLASSDVVWEVEKRRGWWKPLPLNLRKELENLYFSDTGGVIPLKTRGYIHYKGDFVGEEPYLINDAGKRMRLRRSQFDGFFIRWASIAHLNTLHAWINNLQVDNHVPRTSNPIILHTWPQPEAIVSRHAPKPFLEGTVIFRKEQYGGGLAVQMLQVLIQELALKLDIEFITSLTVLLEAFSDKTPPSKMIAEESKMANTPLGEQDITQTSTTSTRHYFRLLHLSPLLVHLTLALEMPKDAKVLNVPILGTIVHVLGSFAGLIGRTKDAEMKLGYYQLEDALLTQQALKERVLTHYIQQGLMQFYSVVLGLEVLGNPVGFLRGVAEGTKGIFYHPIEGAVLGPEEFIEGLSLGSREFVGGTLGGLSGVLSQMLGVTGDAIAKLSFDTEHQEIRLQHTGSIGYAIGGVARGVFHGLTGLVADPVKGAQKKGPMGLLTGTGKGIAGLITKPTGAIVDLTSAALIAIQKKIQVGSVDIVQFRPTRYIEPDKVVHPYSQHKAEGYAIFVKYCLNTGNSDVLEMDTFVDYVELNSKPLRCLIVTSQRFVVTKENILSGMDHREFKFRKVLEPVTATTDGIIIRVLHHQPFYAGHKLQAQEEQIGNVPEGLVGKAVSIINQAYTQYKSGD